jgi:uncharacterized protein DUF4239
MTELLHAGVLLLALLASSALGLGVRPLLAEHHRSREMTEFVQLVVTMLITFVALVLGLLTTSVKASYDRVGNQLKGAAIAIIQLDRALREWGPETEPARELLRAYTAAVIATTWTDQPKPPGDYYPAQLPPSGSGSHLDSQVLGDMLARIELDIRQLEPRDAMHRRLAANCLAQFERLMQMRLRLIEDSPSSIPTPFYIVLTFWLVIVFASFGLNAPRNVLSYSTIALGALSIASVVFVILDLDAPFEGVFTVSSQPWRDALTHMSQ